MTLEELRMRYPNKAEWFYAEMIRQDNASRRQLASQPATPSYAFSPPPTVIPPKASNAKERAKAPIFAESPLQPARPDQLGPTRFKLFVPIPIDSSANSRPMVWQQRAKKVKKLREAVGLFLSSLRSCRELGIPTVVTFNRIGRQTLDRDNLVSAFKGVQDEIASILGFDDREKSVVWLHEQSLNRKVAPGFEVEVRWGGVAICPCCKQPITTET